jgi:hypothetical protein
MQDLSLRAYTKQFLIDMDNPNHVSPRAKQWTMQNPAERTPPKVSAEWRQILDDLYEGLEQPADDLRLVQSAQTAATHISDLAAKADVLQDIAKRNRAEVGEIRDLYKNKDLLRTPREAIDKLNELKVQEKFLIPDAMAHNMQALVSKRNQKVDGKRFKTKMIVSATPVLQVWRTR